MFYSISLKGEQTANKWKIKLKHSTAFSETKNLDYLSKVHLKTNLFLGAQRYLFILDVQENCLQILVKKGKLGISEMWLVPTNLTSIHI